MTRAPPATGGEAYETGTTVLNNDFPSDTLEVHEGKSQAPVATSEGKSQGPISRVSEGKHPYRKVLTRAVTLKDSISGGAEVVALPMARQR